VEDTPLKGLYALAFVLSSFATCAQTPDARTTLIFDLDDYFGEITEPGAFPAQIIATEPTVGKSGEAAHGTHIQASDEAPPVQYTLAAENTAAPSTVPAQIIPEPNIDSVGKASDNADTVAIAEEEDAPVGAIQPSAEKAIVQSPIWWDDKLIFEDMEPSTMPAQIVAPEPTIKKFGEASDKADDVAIADAADIPVGAIEPSPARTTTLRSLGEYHMMVDEAVGQNEGLPQAF
jgi:hypothetical protein